MNKKIKTLSENKWSDRYFCKLAILDHLRECLEKDNYLKATDTPKDSPDYQNLEKELMDLYILLNIYFKDSPQLLETRLDKFISKLNNPRK
jgi:hypothetical protein